MNIGIDATNIRAGGGLTHLKEILSKTNEYNFPFKKVIIWSNTSTLSQLPDYSYIKKESHTWLNKSFIYSFMFQLLKISHLAKKENCTILFVPGGTFLGNFEDIVSMSQNMLPFQKEERNRYKSLKSKFRFKLLYYTQRYTFKKAKALIFLTNFAKDYISKDIQLKTKSLIIPHGINLSFLNEPKAQKNISEFSFENPFKLLYVSIITVYKHQWNVAEAVLKLHKDGYPITLDLIGGNTAESLDKLKNVQKKDLYSCIKYHGQMNHNELENFYKAADAFVFSSSCENMPIILIEAMTAGLPIASSNLEPMPEVLGDAGFYFNPLEMDEIYNSIKNMIDSPFLRQEKSIKSYNKSKNYTWKDCSKQTFDYLFKIANSVSNENSK